MAIGLVPSAGRMPPGGATSGGPALAVAHVEDLGEPRILIATHGGIDDVVGNDARFIVEKPNAAQRAFREIACFRNAQSDSADGRHGYLLGAYDAEICAA